MLKNVGEDTDGFFCSELVATALRALYLTVDGKLNVSKKLRRAAEVLWRVGWADPVANTCRTTAVGCAPNCICRIPALAVMSMPCCKKKR